MAFANDCLDTIGVCPNRLRTICFGQKTEGQVTLDLWDLCANVPIDLTLYDIPPGSKSSSSSSSNLSSSFSSSSSASPEKHGVEIILKALPSLNQHISQWAILPSVEDAKIGRITIPIDRIMSRHYGVWCAMAIIWEHGVQRLHYPFYAQITPNLGVYNGSGPLHFAEVRLAIRDICPEMNFLIDQVEFKDEELAWAMQRPIDYWNEMPPPVSLFTYGNFPYRYHWLEATVAELMFMAATWMRRNDLDYSAAGLTVEDTKKWPDYIKMGQERRQRWETFVKNKKMEINLAGAYATLLGYRSAPYR